MCCVESCVNCGEEAEENEKYCYECLYETYCEMCGENIAPNAEFCEECSEKVDEQEGRATAESHDYIDWCDEQLSKRPSKNAGIA